MTMDSRAAASKDTSQIPVMDYEGSNYRQAFWEGQGREYEDLIERAVLQRVLPPSGRRIAEIGAGFGRLADLYTGYEQIVLFDYSRTLLADAVARWGSDPRFVFVAGNIYDLPLASGVLDTLVMLRVMHHLADPLTALTQLERVLHTKSVAVLEYANKRNLKSIGRWVLGRQDWSPFEPQPVEFVKLNYDFHPRWMMAQFAYAGLHVERRFSLSHFRLPLLKQMVSPEQLVRIEQKFVELAGRYPLAPSALVTARSKSHRAASDAGVNVQSVAALFRCPQCGAEAFTQPKADLLHCASCDRMYEKRSQIWDFKDAVPPQDRNVS
ncbi:MAG: class I SAM-dependent methyltransferase [Caldilineaceae bacterium]|nr:class I SAM-dependent methyltransferase [Caldilineaceae bacterium]